MSASSFWLRTYIVGLGIITLGLTFVYLRLYPAPTGVDLAVVGLLTLFAATAYRHPIHFDVKTSIILDTSIIFASVLLFEPGTAMVIVIGGGLAGILSRHSEIEETVFNVAQAALQAAAAGTVLVLLGWDYGPLNFDSGRILVTVVAAGAAIYLTNTLLVSFVISLHTGMSPVRLWLQSATRHDGIEQAGQFALGAVAAIVAGAQPWALPILLIPAIVIGMSLKKEQDLRDRSIYSVRRIADLVDMRDPYTASHSRRVAGISREIATRMGLDPSEILTIERAGFVHDIGKIVIDLGLLAKEDRLTEEEWAVFRQHPVTGVKMLELYPDFAKGIAIVRSHHERVDGSGYPDGLRGDEIPLGARILAVADGFDAMASPRPYRNALPAEIVIAELENGRGTQWDADAVDALLDLIASGRINVGDADQRPYIIDSIGYTEDLEFDVA